MKCTTTVSARAIVGAAEDSFDSENMTIAGAAETDDTEVAVSPAGPLPASAVITATPAGWSRNTVR
ncbi:Uncharacterised protein [Mycobacteroides abscessus subsp. abscessus]|nr:Uncharacterised protein [Mycobacteroides abscessus subsp. abscessus]